MSERVFVDTNIFVYRFDGAEPIKQERAASALREEARRSVLVISTQILQELYWNLAQGKKPKLQPASAEGAVRSLAASFEVVQVTTGLVLSAVARVRTARWSFWDALVVEAALAAGCVRLLTEDLHDGQVIDDLLTIENPLRSSLAAHSPKQPHGRPATGAPRRKKSKVRS